MQIRTVLATLVLASPASAQDICSGPQPFDMPSCMVGAWYGDSDMATKMNAILAGLPADVRARMGGDMGRYLFLAVYPDGFFATSPMAGDVDGLFRTEGGTTDFTMDLIATPGSGWMWMIDGGGMGFCTNPGAGHGLMQTTASNGMGTNNEVAISGLAPGGFAPTMSATCDDDLMLMHVDLPDPIGTVTYEMHRIPVSAMDPSFRTLYEGRFDG